MPARPPCGMDAERACEERKAEGSFGAGKLKMSPAMQ